MKTVSARQPRPPGDAMGGIDAATASAAAAAAVSSDGWGQKTDDGYIRIHEKLGSMVGVVTPADRRRAPH